jgi:hypothetical protein
MPSRVLIGAVAGVVLCLTSNGLSVTGCSCVEPGEVDGEAVAASARDSHRRLRTVRTDNGMFVIHEVAPG